MRTLSENEFAVVNGGALNFTAEAIEIQGKSVFDMMDAVFAIIGITGNPLATNNAHLLVTGISELMSFNIFSGLKNSTLGIVNCFKAAVSITKDVFTK